MIVQEADDNIHTETYNIQLRVNSFMPKQSLKFRAINFDFHPHRGITLKQN